MWVELPDHRDSDPLATPIVPVAFEFTPRAFLTLKAVRAASPEQAVVGPLIALGVHDVLQTKHSLQRVYPIIGHGRALMEELRPEIQHYFVESNVDGMPFSREMRSAIYQRAKGQIDTLPFGTQRDVDRDGYEWMSHSMAPKPVLETDPRVEIGAGTCKLAYRAAHLNVSAMSFGSLSSNAILALNAGAKTGGFYHNTGEGGLSPYHLKPGGDLVWQVGTGYFSCRSTDASICISRRPILRGSTWWNAGSRN